MRNIPPLRPGRRIDGYSAVLLPFNTSERPDWSTFRTLLDRTWTAGLTPAVNMDTGFVHLLTAAERSRVLDETAELAAGRPFVAGAFIDGQNGDPSALYARACEDIGRRGGTPILFQCTALARASEADVLEVYRRAAMTAAPLLAFELGSMFAPFGRIYSLDFFRALLDIEAFEGLKHSSLDRVEEWRRLEIRDRVRPSFRLLTGNDLAIDMAFFGSDYLLGLSAFHVEAFAARDRLWAACDPRAFALNDALQYLGALTFRPPVAGYKHSAAQFLHVRGVIPAAAVHPRSPRRPDADVVLLREMAAALDALLERTAR
jgi:dihydrodipicolinate synthase/N-acetylneuraminate lyase